MANESAYQLFDQLCDHFSSQILGQGVNLRKEQANNFRKALTKRLLTVVYQGLLFKGFKSYQNSHHDNVDNSSIRWRSVAYIMHLNYAKRQQNALKLEQLLNQLFERGK